MMKDKLHLLIIAFIIVGVIATGCSISFKTEGGGGNDGGVYISANKGSTWQQKVLIPTTAGRPGNFATLDTNALIMDPADEKAVYFGSFENGLFYTYDGGENWQIAKTLGKISVKAIAVDPSSKCIIYAASKNKVFKSTDCNRSWSQVYFDNDANTEINTIAIDHYNTLTLYIGTSRGEIIKSSNRGISWQTISRFDDDVEKIVINRDDSRIIFVATAKKGIHRSQDGGANWENLKEKLADFKDSLKFRDLVIIEAEKNSLILATSYGLLKSADNGDNWSRLELITPEKEATINSVAVNPKDSTEIYYITNTTFYHSLDNGQNWITKKLPTTRAGRKLLIDPENPNIIYLGAIKVK